MDMNTDIGIDRDKELVMDLDVFERKNFDIRHQTAPKLGWSDIGIDLSFYIVIGPISE